MTSSTSPTRSQSSSTTASPLISRDPQEVAKAWQALDFVLYYLNLVSMDTLDRAEESIVARLLAVYDPKNVHW